MWILFIVLPFLGRGQGGQSPNFYQMMDSFYTHYNPADSGEGGLNNEMQRLYREWGQRLYPHGDFSIASQAMYDYIQDFRNAQNTITTQSTNAFGDKKWENVPIEYTTGTLPAGNGWSWVGRAVCVAFDPRFGTGGNETVYAGSPYGGVFKSEDKGLNWTNFYTDLQLPTIGVADIAIHPQSPDKLFIATGRRDDAINPGFGSGGGTEAFLNSSGVYRFDSDNNNWELIDKVYLGGGVYSTFVDILLSGGTIRRLLISPDDANRMWVATSKGIFTTGNALAANPNDVIWETTSLPLLLSGSADNQLRGIELHPNYSGAPFSEGYHTLYAGGKDMYVSYDDGQTWNRFSSITNFWTATGLVDYAILRTNIATSSVLPNYLFVMVTHLQVDSNGDFVLDANGNKIVLHSLFHCKTNTPYQWTDLGFSNSVQGASRVTLKVSPQGRIHVGNQKAFYYNYSTSSANLFFGPIQVNSIHDDIHDYAICPNDPNYVLCTSDGGVSLSQNAGITYNANMTGMNVGTLWSFDDSEFDDETYAASFQDNGNAVKLKGVPTWDNLGDFGDGYGINLFQDLVFYNIGNGLTNPLKRKNLVTNVIVTEGNGGPDVPSANDYKPVAQDTWGYIKDALPIFNTKDDPEDRTKFYWSWTEIHKRNVADANSSYKGGMGTPGNTALWDHASDLHAHLGDWWQRQITAFDFAEVSTYPMYVVTLGGVYSDFPNLNLNVVDVSVPHLFKVLSPTTSIEIDAAYTNNTLPTVIAYDASGQPFTTTAAIKNVIVDPSNPDKVWISIAGYAQDQKVWASTDGGLTWQNWDSNHELPKLSVNALAYQKGTNDRIFAGTDAGVYVKEGVNGTWEKYGSNLPNVRIMQMKINYCAGELRVATFGRGIWKVDLPMPDAYTEEKLISQNTTWTGHTWLGNNLRIKSGATLTLDHTCTLNMPMNGAIIVEKGAKLVVDGGKITNNCGQMWLGVIVEGDAGASQMTPGAQGEVSLNNAEIEHARNAFAMWNPNTQTLGGGIIRAVKSRFTNNQRSVEFMKYHNYDPATGTGLENESGFRDCIFLIDNAYRGDDAAIAAAFKAHISAWAVQGIDITKCRFENAKTNNITYANDLGSGIYTIDASFKVKGDCNILFPIGTNPPCPTASINPSVFKGLFHGIYAMREGGNETFTVHGARFENNIKGIFSQGVNFPTILQSRFLVGGNPYPILDPQDKGHEGIVINTGTAYTIEENEMLTIPLVGGAYRYTVGTRIRHTGATPNQVYKNRYEGFFVGDLANGNNFDSNSGTGMQFLCNSHTADYADIAAVETGGAFDGIRKEQGDPNSQYDAGNSFSQNGNFAEGDYFNNAASFNYYYKPSTLNDPIYYTTSTIIKIPKQDRNECISNIDFGMGNTQNTTTEIQGKKAQFYASQTAYASLLYTYEQLIDGGNTNALVQNITQNWSNDAWELRTELLNRAPYLSEKALREAIAQDILPQAMVFEICLANPDVLRNDRFIDYLAGEITNPLPSYMIAILLNARLTGSARTVLAQSIVQTHTEMTAIAYPLIRQMLNDSVQVSRDSLILWIGNLQSLPYQYILAEMYYEDGQGATALQTLAAIPTLFPLNEEEVVEHQNYTDLMNFKLAIRETNRDLGQLNETEKAALTTIRDASNRTSGVLANNILCFYYDNCKSYPAVLPQTATQQRKALQNIPSLITGLNKLLVYPNPANEFLTFDYELAEQITDAYMEITDVSGKIIKTIPCIYQQSKMLWDTRDISAGIYLYACKRGNEKLAVGKVVIQH